MISNSCYVIDRLHVGPAVAAEATRVTWQMEQRADTEDYVSNNSRLKTFQAERWSKWRAAANLWPRLNVHHLDSPKHRPS